MPTTYLDPLERAWIRIRRVLFRPFELEKWIVLGFGAFLAGLAGSGTGLGFSRQWRFNLRPDFDAWATAPYDSFTETFLGSRWFPFGVMFALLGFLLLVAFLWISSRGKFIFLDNLVRERVAVVDPWKAYERLGNSLFLWRLGLCVAVLLAFGMLVVPGFVLSRGLDRSDLGHPIGALLALSAGFVSLVLGIATGYAALFLENFVVPLMYHRSLTTTEAWRVFLPLLRQDPVAFLMYGVLILLAFIGVGLCVLASFVVTCCILPLLLSVPYLNSVLLLPLTGLYRLYSLEFLAGFGPEYVILPTAPAEAVDEPVPPPV